MPLNLSRNLVSSVIGPIPRMVHLVRVEDATTFVDVLVLAITARECTLTSRALETVVKRSGRRDMEHVSSGYGFAEDSNPCNVQLRIIVQVV